MKKPGKTIIRLAITSIATRRSGRGWDTGSRRRLRRWRSRWRWQLHWGRRFYDPVNLDLASRRLRSLAILGLATSAAEAWLWLLWLDTSARGAVLSILALPYGLAALWRAWESRLPAGCRSRAGRISRPVRLALHLGRRGHDNRGYPGCPRGEAAGRDRYHDPLRRTSPGGSSGWDGGVSRLFRGQCRGDHRLRLDRQTCASAAQLKPVRGPYLNILWPRRKTC